MAFAGDMYVFPGGRVDSTDAEPSLVPRSALSPDETAAALGGEYAPAVALAAHLAAIRELFEEAGVLLAETSASAAAVATGRSALLGGSATLADLASNLDLRLRTDLLVPLSRWVTPPTFPRRFDARFFAAALPVGTEPSFEGGEVVAHAWHRPADALDAMADGRLGCGCRRARPSSSSSMLGRSTRSGAPFAGALGEIEVEDLSPMVTRIVMPAGGEWRASRSVRTSSGTAGSC